MVTSGLSWVRGGIPGIYVVLLHDQLSALGLDAQVIWDQLPYRREQLLAPDSRLTLAQAQQVAERAVALAGDQGLGFRYARALGITLHGPLGLLAMSSASADDALTASCRYLALRAPFLTIDRDSTDNGEVVVSLRPLLPLGAVHDFVIEAMLVGLVYMVEQLLETPPRELVIHRRGPAPRYRAELEAALPVPIHFQQQHDGLLFPQQALNARPRLADPQTAALALEQCELEFRQWRARHQGVMAERVRDRLRQHPAPLPSLEAMAEQLAVSARTLKRHLQRAGTSFLLLLEESRRRDAQQLLQHSPLPVHAVAARLGYRNPANFSRAFSKWTGESPMAFRRKQRDKGTTV